MNRLIGSMVLISVAAAAGQSFAADPGTRWRVTTSMSGLGFDVPPRVVETCAVGDRQAQPPPTAQKDCKFTELSRDGSTVRYSVHCSTMDGAGEITYGADHYSGKFNMQMPRGTVTATYEGEKLGSCNGTEANTNAGLNGSSSQSGINTSSGGAMSTVGSAVKSGVATGAGEIKDTATEVATDATQSAKDDAKESVKEKAESALRGLFNH